MSSLKAGAALLHAVHEDAVEQGRDEGRKEALTSAIKTVDMLLAHSETIEEFQWRWDATKAMYEELTA